MTVVDTIKNLLEVPHKSWDRASVRLEAKLKICLTITPDNQTIRSTSLNVSRGGAFVGTTTLLPAVGQSISFELTPSSEKATITGKAIVRWARATEAPKSPRGFGIEFAQLTTENEKLISEMLELFQTIE